MFTSTALGNHMKSRSHDEAMAELYRSDPALALAVVNDILTDGDRENWRSCYANSLERHFPHQLNRRLIEAPAQRLGGFRVRCTDPPDTVSRRA